MGAVDLGIEKLERILIDYYKDKGTAENIFLKAFTYDNSSSAGSIGANISTDIKKK